VNSLPFRLSSSSPDSFAGLDLDLYKALNGLADRHHAVADVSRFVGDYGQIVFLSLLGCLFLARGKWYSRNGRHGVARRGLQRAARARRGACDRLPLGPAAPV
jgi:hypothetical protein